MAQSATQKRILAKPFLFLFIWANLPLKASATGFSDFLDYFFSFEGHVRDWYEKQFLLFLDSSISASERTERLSSFIKRYLQSLEGEKVEKYLEGTDKADFLQKVMARTSKETLRELNDGYPSELGVNTFRVTVLMQTKKTLWGRFLFDFPTNKLFDRRWLEENITNWVKKTDLIGSVGDYHLHKFIIRYEQFLTRAATEKFDAEPFNLDVLTRFLFEEKSELILKLLPKEIENVELLDALVEGIPFFNLSEMKTGSIPTIENVVKSISPQFSMTRDWYDFAKNRLGELSPPMLVVFTSYLRFFLLHIELAGAAKEKKAPGFLKNLERERDYAVAALIKIHEEAKNTPRRVTSVVVGLIIQAFSFLDFSDPPMAEMVKQIDPGTIEQFVSRRKLTFETSKKNHPLLAKRINSFMSYWSQVREDKEKNFLSRLNLNDLFGECGGHFERE